VKKNEGKNITEQLDEILGVKPYKVI